MESKARRVLITGANQGIGFATAELMAKKGYEVVMACRSADRAKEAAESIRLSVPNAQISVVIVDLGSLQSVRNCATELFARFGFFDFLILNAGVLIPLETQTADGYSTTFQVNYLSQYVLAELLISHQTPTHPIKVITLTSCMYKLCGLVYRLEKNAEQWFPMLNNVRNHWRSYAMSKFAMALLAESLSRREGVSAAAVHPGIVATQMCAAVDERKRKRLRFLRRLFISKELAAENVLKCVEERIPAGKFQNGAKVGSHSSAIRDPANVQRLDQLNEQLFALCIQ